MKSRILATIGLVLAACAAAPHIMPKPQATRRLGLTLSDAGIPVDDAGNSTYAFTSPLTNPLTGAPIPGCHPAGFYGDFELCQLTSTLVCGEHKIQSVAQLSSAQCGALFSLIKAGAQAQLADAGVDAAFQ